MLNTHMYLQLQYQRPATLQNGTIDLVGWGPWCSGAKLTHRFGGWVEVKHWPAACRAPPTTPAAMLSSRVGPSFAGLGSSAADILSLAADAPASQPSAAATWPTPTTAASASPSRQSNITHPSDLWRAARQPV